MKHAGIAFALLLSLALPAAARAQEATTLKAYPAAASVGDTTVTPPEPPKAQAKAAADAAAGKTVPPDPAAAKMEVKPPLVITPVKEPTLQDIITQKLSTVEDRHFITFNSENDLYASGDDRNYTNGARVTYYKMGEQPPAFFNAIDRLIPTFTINPTTSIYYSLGQNIYTPKDITRATQDPNDRPWAAFLYGSAGMTSVTDNHIDEVEATLGIIGPYALGKEVQTFVHDHISDSPTPRGWDNQLKTEPGVMLSWERRFPERFGFDAGNFSAGVEPHFGVTLGNVYTYANTGLSFRLSPHEGRWQDDPIRVRPNMPGTGAFFVPENKWSWELFGGVEGRAVARDIFLDGNTFADSYSVDKVPLVGDATAGLAFTYNKVRISYAVVYRTKEFQDQDDPSVFGTVSLGIRY